MTPVDMNHLNAAQTIIKGLQKRQMEGYYAQTAREAVQTALSLMPEGSSVGWGGSMSLSESGLMDALKEKDLRIIDRALAVTPEEKQELSRQLITADTFLMSTNAITMDGELFNIDGNGNRLCYLLFGPRQVIVLCGMNKVVPDMDSAVARARNMAAPPNCVRLNRKTPCSQTGRCENCFSADCICSQFVYTRRSGTPGRIKVILCGEALGY